MAEPIQPDRAALMFLTFLLAILVMVLSFVLLETVSEAKLPGYDKILILQPETIQRPTPMPTPGPRPTPSPEEHRLHELERGLKGVVNV